MKQYTFLVLSLLIAFPAQGQSPNYLMESAKDKNKRMEWWQEARFGLFIHWGLYAVPAGAWDGKDYYGEWIMEEAKIPIKEYEKFAPKFNPTLFDAEKWVSMAKMAGMKYIVITSKHHDGFCLWDSQVSDYDIMDRTPFNRDILKELAAACKKQGLRMCFYHSIMDWHHPDAKGNNFEKYRDQYLKPQLKELIQNYGPVGVLWFDGEWIDEWTEDQGRNLYQYVRSLQPDIIVNNRVGKGRNGMQGMTQNNAVGDFGTPEQEILGEKSNLDWESCMTMNSHWGYNRADKNFKAAEDLIWNLVDCAAKGGNYLLNVGPTAEGLFPEESVAILEKMGEWVQKNGAAIYDSKPWVHHAEGDGIRYTANKNGSVNVFMKPSVWKPIIAEHIAQTSDIKQPHSMIRGAHALLKQARLTNDSLRYFEFNNGIGALVQTTEGLKVQLGRIQLPKSDEIIMITLPLIPASVATKPIIGDGKRTYVFSEKMDIPIHQTGTEQQIRFTLDGTEPHPESPLYSTPIVIQQSGILQSRAYEAGKISSPTAVARFVRADAGISINMPPATQYAGSGDITLLDGLYGSIDFHKGNWLGFSGKDVIVTLDFGQKKEINHFTANFLRRQSSWIFMPTSIEWAISDDGAHWQPIHTEQMPIATDTATDSVQKLEFTQKTTTRFVRLVAHNQGRCPNWHPGAGGEAWLFVDEVEVR